MIKSEIEKIDFEKCQKFSDFARHSLPMPGTKKQLNDVINREIFITDFRLRNSTQRPNSECLQLQFMMDGEICVLFTGSAVLISQLKESESHIPFSTTIKKVDRYYSFA